MPPTDEELLNAFTDIPSFLSDGPDEIARSDSDRYRDFIITEKYEDDGSVSFNFGEVDLDPDSYDQLQWLVRNNVKSRVTPLEEGRKEFARYGEARDDRDTVKYLTSEDLPLLEQVDDLFNETDIESTTYHNGLDPNFQAIRIRDHEDKMVIGLQHYWKNQLLGNTSLFNLYYKEGGGHEPIDEPIISIPDRLDAVYYDGILFIFQDWRFEQMFDYHRVYEEISEQVIDAVRENEVEFQDMDMVEDAILSNPIMMRKLDDVQRTGYYENIDIDDIEWVIDEYEREGISVEGTGPDREVVLSNRRKVWELIHILNDDHVESRLTDTAYQATGSKEEI